MSEKKAPRQKNNQRYLTEKQQIEVIKNLHVILKGIASKMKVKIPRK
jgi:hypothetical protein